MARTSITPDLVHSKDQASRDGAALRSLRTTVFALVRPMTQAIIARETAQTGGSAVVGQASDILASLLTHTHDIQRLHSSNVAALQAQLAQTIEQSLAPCTDEDIDIHAQEIAFSLVTTWVDLVLQNANDQSFVTLDDKLLPLQTVTVMANTLAQWGMSHTQTEQLLKAFAKSLLEQNRVNPVNLPYGWRLEESKSNDATVGAKLHFPAQASDVADPEMIRSGTRIRHDAPEQPVDLTSSTRNRKF